MALRKSATVDAMRQDSHGDSLMHVSKLNEVTQELTGHLIALEEYYMIENVHKVRSLEGEG
jgi:hypothetical protein